MTAYGASPSQMADLLLDDVQKQFRDQSAGADNSFLAYRPGGLLATSFNPRKASDWLDEVPETVEWIVEDFLARGTLVVIAGKPKEGKTTLVYDCAKAIAQGLPVLGRTTQKSGVLILAVEEHRRDVTARLRALGAETLDNLHLHIGGMTPNATLYEAIHAYVAAHNIGLVVVDTLASFWTMKDENDASQVTMAVKPLLQLARESGACVLLIHHARKSEGSHGDEIRGSGALFGLVDVALVMKRHSVETQRLLQAQSRFPETPRELVIELRDGGYAALGDPADVGKAEKRRRVREALTNDLQTVEDLKKKTGLSQRDLARVLTDLHKQNEAFREGAGKRSDPFRYKKPAPDTGSGPNAASNQEAADSLLAGGPVYRLATKPDSPDSLLAPPQGVTPPARNETDEDLFDAAVTSQRKGADLDADL